MVIVHPIQKRLELLNLFSFLIAWSISGRQEEHATQVQVETKMNSGVRARRKHGSELELSEYKPEYQKVRLWLPSAMQVPVCSLRKEYDFCDSFQCTIETSDILAYGTLILPQALNQNTYVRL